MCVCVKNEEGKEYGGMREREREERERERWGRGGDMERGKMIMQNEIANDKEGEDNNTK